MPQVAFLFESLYMTYSLFELNEFIRRVLALNLSDPVWVRCELAQMNISRGHCYLGLVEKSEDGSEIIAQGNAVIWQGRFKKLRKKLGKEFNAILNEGMQVLIQVKVDFNERYGLKLMVEDIDPAYTLGKMELKRLETIKALEAKGLMDKNSQLELPLVVQRLAIISSETAAGLEDFMRQLETNNYGYHFKTRLFSAAMQGAKVSEEVTAQLNHIEMLKSRFDAVVIIRGGGAKLDLAAFDDFDISEKVADFPLPVLVGIGHEVDETVLDLVAHSSLKTPTAVAEYIIQKAMYFESEVLEQMNEVGNLAKRRLIEEKALLEQLHQSIELGAFHFLKKEKMMLEFIAKEVPQHCRRILRSEKNKFEFLEKSVELLRPETAFKRGFSLTSKKGEIILEANQLKEGDEVETQVKSGKFISVVKKKKDA